MHLINIHGLSFSTEQGCELFKSFSVGFGLEKTGFVGRNGLGKSMLVRILIGEVLPKTGKATIKGRIGYLAQNVAWLANKTVAGNLGIEEKLQAIERIYAGKETLSDYEIVGDDWDLIVRAKNTLECVGLETIGLDRMVESLSGGEITQFMLAKVILSEPDYLILDEPANNLDAEAREKLYRFIKEWKKGLLVISHDRRLLRLMDQILEITSIGLNLYGGNFNYYEEKKAEEVAAAKQEYESAKREQRKTEKDVKQQIHIKAQRDAKAHKVAVKARMSKLQRNGLKEQASRTQGKLKIKHERILEEMQERKKAAWERVEVFEKLDFELPDPIVPNGKLVVQMNQICFSYGKRKVLEGFDFKIFGPERVALRGRNGSGKTTVINLIMRELEAQKGEIKRGVKNIAYLDQHVKCLDREKTILENFHTFNPKVEETTCRHVLARFLFPNIEVLKKVEVLSGGERLRAGLACLLMVQEPPELLILDEPTNYLDLDSIKSIEQELAEYQGAMIVVSHDEEFLKNIRINREVWM